MNPYIPAGYIPGLYSSGTYTGDTKGGGGGKSPLADKNVLPATWAQRQSMGLTYVPSPYGKGQSQYMPGVGIGLQAGVGGRTNKLQPYGNWMAIVLRRTAGEAGMNMTDDELMAAWDEFQQTEGWQFGTLGGGRRRGGGKGGQTWNDFLSGRVVQGEIPVGIQQAGAGPMGWASGLVTQRY